MPTLEELLKDKDPEALKRLLSANSSSVDDDTSSDDDDSKSKDDMSSPDHPIHELMRNANTERKQREERKNPEVLQKLLSQLNSSDQTPVTTPPIGDPEDIAKNVALSKQNALTLPQSAHLPVGQLVPASTNPPPVDSSAPPSPQTPDTPPTPPTEEPEEESDPSAVAGLFAKRSPADQSATPPIAPPPTTPGFSQNTVQNLKDIQDKANDEKLRNQTFRNLNLFATGLAGGNAAGLKANNEPFDDADKMEDEKVAQFKEQLAKEGDDPESNYSKEFRAYISPLLQKVGISPDTISKSSASQIKELLPWTEKMDVSLENREARLEAAKLRSQDMNLRQQELKQSKETGAQDRGFTNTRGILEANRGNPAVQQAETTIANAQKLKSITNGQPLDQLSPQMTHLAMFEVAKMALGGTPTEGEVKDLQNGAIPARLASTMQVLTNKPQAASQGAFLKQYMDYATGLSKDAEKVINDKYKRVIESAHKSGQISDKGYGALTDEYLNRFQNDAPKALPAGQEIVNMNGKNYIVDHNTKKVIGEAP